MPKILQSFEANLRNQVKIYERLNLLEQSKQKALLKNNLQEIESISAQEEQLFSVANQLEKERLSWAEHIGRDLGKAPEDLTLAELAEHFPVLQEVSRDLDKVVGNLQEVHAVNTQLLEQAMKVVEFTVGMLTHQDKSTYNRPSVKENEGLRKLHLLDRRI